MAFTGKRRAYVFCNTSEAFPRNKDSLPQ